MCSTRINLRLGLSQLPAAHIGKPSALAPATLFPHQQKPKLRKPQARALRVAVVAKERVVLVDTHNTFTTNWKASKYYSNPIGIIVLLVAAFASVAPIFYNRWKRQQRQRLLTAKRGATRGSRQPFMQAELQQLMNTLARGKPGQTSFRGPGQVEFHPTSDSGSKVAIFLSGLNSSEFDQYSTSTGGEEVVKRYLSWAANGKELKEKAGSGAAGEGVDGEKQMVGSS